MMDRLEERRVARNFRAYLAGPEVFLPEAVAIGRQKKRLCAKYGFEGLYPFDNEIRGENEDVPTDILIYRANVEMIAEADFGVLNLTPFRGPHADVGTAFEFGLLTGLNKPVWGYTNDVDDLLTRVKHHDIVTFDPAAKVWRDSSGLSVENFGNAENLMIEAALLEQGHPLFRHATPPAERYRDFTGFEHCLRLAAEAYAREDVPLRRHKGRP
jgi:nucleoside 2-deoxyribosyltransferase